MYASLGTESLLRQPSKSLITNNSPSISREIQQQQVSQLKCFCSWIKTPLICFTRNNVSGHQAQWHEGCVWRGSPFQEGPLWPDRRWETKILESSHGGCRGDRKGISQNFSLGGSIEGNLAKSWQFLACFTPTRESFWYFQSVGIFLFLSLSGVIYILLHIQVDTLHWGHFPGLNGL